MSKSQEIGRATYRHEPLEEILMLLVEYGEPRISKIDGGWYCAVEMNTNVAGAEYRVKSDFGHATPTAAAIQCQDRVREAVASRNRSLTQ